MNDGQRINAIATQGARLVEARRTRNYDGMQRAYDALIALGAIVDNDGNVRTMTLRDAICAWPLRVHPAFQRALRF